MTESPELPRKLMLLIAAIQGILLLFLYNAIDSGTWPSQTPMLNYPAWLLALAVPVFLLLTLEIGNGPRAARLIGAFAILLTVIGAYIGCQATPYGEFPVSNLTWAFIWTMGLACFKALMYLQQRAAGKRMTYDVLFTYSWRNFLTVALSLILVLVFWLILVLWAQLFDVIGIEFFENLFEQDWFLFPVLSVAHGVGVIIFRDLTRVIDSITRLFQGLIKILLPLAIVVAVVFLGALPFVGLDVLWATGRGTALLLWLFATILFFTNAVYQDGSGDRPYPIWIHRVIYGALLTTPIISVLSFYGLYLRLEEYGWTVTRAWAFVVWLVLTLFALGYVTGIVRRKDLWTVELAKVNTVMGLVVMSIMLLANSPVLDFRKMSLSSQVARVESGEVQISEFDFSYAKNSLARPGFRFMQAKLAEIGDNDPDLRERIENPVALGNGYRNQFPEQLWASMIFRPEEFDVPDSLQQEIDKVSYDVAEQVRPVLFRVDLDGDQIPEYALVYVYNEYVSGGVMFYEEGGVWKSTHLEGRGYSTKDSTVDDMILHGQISIAQPRFNNLKLDEFVLRPLDPY